MKKAIYAGSFDPITNGHLWVINQGANLFEKLYVVIAYNPQKQGFFSAEQRLKLIQESVQHLNNVEVVLLTNDYVASYAQEVQANYLLRGIRNATDYEYEKTIERVNYKINPTLQTVYLTPPSELSEISSSMVKSLVGFPNWQKLVTNMVPSVVVSGFLYQKNYQFLKNEWLKLAGQSPSTLKWFEYVLQKHSESHRYYHNTNHLVSLLNNSQDLPVLNTLHNVAIKYAIFFHDVIYNPQEKNNEANSCQKFLEFAKECKIDGYISNMTSEMILATANHSQPVTLEVSYFLDLDLSILGADLKTYNQYEQDIRNEYHFVPEDVFKVERHKIMKTLIDPFKTDWGKNKYLSNAQNNLARYQS